MVNKYRYSIIILLAIGALNQAVAATDLPMLKAMGTLIVDSNNKTVILKGCNIGNWFSMEMWMLHLYDNKIRDQYTFENVLTSRFGYQEKERLMDVFRANWITDKDFEIIKSFGMNCVRLPVYYQLIEDDNNHMHIKPNAFKWLDYALDAAEKQGIYTIICLHGAAGGQSKMGHCGREDFNQFWHNESYKKRTFWLWQQIAERYKDRACVAGYDLLNEPWDIDISEQLKAFDSIYEAIRTVDNKHIIFIQGHDSIKEMGNPADRNWGNVVYSLHRYPGIFDGGPPTKQNQARFLKEVLKDIYNELNDFNVPFLMGEFNVVYTSAGGDEMMRYHFDTYANYGWAATMWAYKVITIPGEERRGFWEMVTNKNPLPDINISTASVNEIERYFKSLSSDYAIYDDLKKALTDKRQLPPLLEPPPPPKPIMSTPFNDKPIGWTANDIGTIITGGQKVYSVDAMDIYASGADIYLSNDQFRFIWKKIEGDCDISATVDELTFVHMFAKAGVMIRGDLSDDSVFAMLNVRPAGELEFVCRYQKAQHVKTDGHLGHDFPGINIKLIRKGQTIESYHSKGNDKWEKFMIVTLPELPKTAYVGIFCLSHDNSQLAKAAFTNIKSVGKIAE